MSQESSKRPLSEYIGELNDLGGLSAIDGHPQSLQIAGDHLYWLQGMQQVLYTVSLKDPAALPRRVLPQDTEAAVKPDEFRPSSKEEELLRERQRTRVTGISSYDVRVKDGAVFYISGTNLFLYLPKIPGPPLRVFDYMDNATRQRYFSAGKPFLCIQHVDTSDTVGEGPREVSFVYDSNLYMALIEERHETLVVQVEQLTDFGDATHECGTADYIIQEEFSRYTGHYARGRQILFSYTDTSMLRSVTLLDDGDGAAGASTMTYCRVGDTNAHTRLVVLDRDTRQMRAVPPRAIASIAPWAEYTPRFGFVDSTRIYFSLLSRTQERGCVVSCAVDALPCVSAAELDGWEGPAEIPLRVEWSQHVPWAWVEVPAGKPMYFGKSHDLILSHASETETAHWHLFVRSKGGHHNHSHKNHSPNAAWRPLTCGEWNVMPGTLRLLSDRVLFLANAEDRLGKTLYSVLLPEGDAEPQKPVRLTPNDELVTSYTATSGGYLCYTAGTARAPPEVYMAPLHTPNTRRVVQTKWVEESANEKGVIAIKDERLILPHTITLKSRRGVTLSGKLFITPKAVPGEPGPLAMYVYGGPHVQLVYTHQYGIACKPLFQVLAQRGVSVLVVDGQMSNANGLRVLSICKNNMGNFETDDHVDIARYIATEKTLPNGFIADPARIAIFGWSYGGYATLLAMSQAATVFKIGFAGAPVGNWTLYDTGYTERYMGELYETQEKGDDENTRNRSDSKKIRDAYVNSAIKKFVSGFPDDLNRVFIAHGLLDENVHFSHTCEVVKEMVLAGKPCNTIMYPGERHGLRQNKTSRLHHDAMVIKTFVELL